MNQQQILDGLKEIQITFYQNGISFTKTFSASNFSQFTESVFSQWQSNQNEQNQFESIVYQISEIQKNNQILSNKLMSNTHYKLKIQDLEQDISQMKSQIQSQKTEITRLEQFIQEQNKLLDRQDKLFLQLKEIKYQMNSIQNNYSQPISNGLQVDEKYNLKPKVEYDNQYRSFSNTFKSQQYQ